MLVLPMDICSFAVAFSSPISFVLLVSSFDFNLKFTNIWFLNIDLNVEFNFEFEIGNNDRFHHQSCCNCGRLVDRFNCNVFSEECPKFSSSLKYQQCYPLNVCVRESFGLYYWS